MKCLILAAGYATRLYPLTENFPKPLLKVGDRTILDWLVDDIDATGLIDEYIIISNHKFHSFFDEWIKTKPQKMTVLDDGSVSNETRLGAVRDIRLAVKTFDINDDCLIVAGDNLLDFSLSGFIRYSVGKAAPCIMRYYEPDYNRLVKCGVVEIDADDRVLSMTEKSFEPKSNWCCPPFYFYTKDAMAMVSEALNAGCGYDAPGSLAAWMCAKTDLYAMEMPGKRYDIGDVSSLENARQTYKGILK